VIGVEVSGRVRVATVTGEPRELHFRADRVDETPEGWLLLDYKTGKPKVASLKPDTRRTHYLERVADGSLLQATAYGQGARGLVGGEARGEYVHLRPGIDRRTAELGPGDAADELEAEFANSVGAVLDVWDTGAFFPRLVSLATEREPGACQNCDVREACWRGDSGARARLLEWGAKREPGDETLPPHERARLELWLRGGNR
jgi:hypothetical protein